MKDRYIYMIVIGVILVVFLCSWIVDMKFSFTYMGNTGLWHLTLQLIFILFSKILIGGLSTFGLLLVLQLLIILTLVACKSKYIDSLIEKKKIKIPNKYVIIGAIIGAIVNFVFIPSEQLRLHNKADLKDYKVASELAILTNAIKDIVEMESYDIICSTHSYKQTFFRLSTSRNAHTYEETFIKFDDRNYIIVTPEDKKFIEDNWNEDGVNTVTLYKNSGVICKINGKTLN